MGLKTMAHSLFGSNEKANTRSTMNRKRNIVCHRDEEYQPFEGEKGDNMSSSKDDESSWSHVKKFRHMAYRKKQGGYSAQLLRDSQSTSKLVNTPLPRQLSARQGHNRGERMPIVAEQPTQPPTSTTEQDNQHPNLDVVSSSTGKKRVRDPTREKIVDKLRKQIGRSLAC